ncbi:hypothetical protein [Bosea sp. PAMC 26642]|uniref:hypothetical protein n=1 Tax=Bosea sp. (strain PAMC 26642) TaxID=1792307 RepID=UPI000770321F|nr:hypothetical protein [Bosea sp. PAMC 26642]AMJ62845.1 hypothetical protein AXW83_23395 [Bosea sp. PAMC 26642]
MSIARIGLDLAKSVFQVEHATLQLARQCGLQTAESQVARIGGRDVLLVKRSHRTRVEDSYARARMVSGPDPARDRRDA